MKKNKMHFVDDFESENYKNNISKLFFKFVPKSWLISICLALIGIVILIVFIAIKFI